MAVVDSTFNLPSLCIHRSKSEEEEKEHERSRIAYKEKQKKRKNELEEKTTGEEFEIAPTDEAKNVYKEYVEKNTDAYGKAAVDYAIAWAKLMQAEIKAGKKLQDVADKTSHDADTDGITGFMYGCAVSMLSQCWKHGEELRKWHNKEYDHEGDGVVNPAVLTISVPEKK